MHARVAQCLAHGLEVLLGRRDSHCGRFALRHIGYALPRPIHASLVAERVAFDEKLFVDHEGNGLLGHRTASSDLTNK